MPHLELSVEIDMARCMALQDASTEAILVRACALALREHPRANGSYRDGRFELYPRVNVGVVVAGEAAYLIPTVFDADLKPLAELKAELDELRAGALRGRLTSPSFSGATFTLWNAGALGLAGASIPVVAPQAAALAAGEIRGSLMHATLACDHRILYGAPAAAFLGAVRSRLERAEL